MSNDKVQSIMALVSKYAELCGNGVTAQNVMDADKVWREIESAIRAIAAPGVAQGWKLIGWTCGDGDCGRIHDEPPDALDDFTQAVYVMSAPPTEHEVKP